MGRITNKVARRLAASGITSDTHHAQIKAEYKREFGDSEPLTKDEVAEIRAMIGGDIEATTEEVPTAEAPAEPKAKKAKNGKKEQPVEAVAPAKAKKAVKAKKAKKEKVEEPVRSPEELMAEAEKFVKQQKKEVGGNWANVVKVIETTNKGRPARVVIKCSDPMKAGDGSKICDGTREIAIQDLFQVTRCVSCQARAVQLYRNDLAKRRRQELQKSRTK